MSTDIVGLFKKYKSVFLYLIFGVATTVINVVVYFIFARMLHISPTASTCIAWVFAVLFAYITNRIWVFSSQAKTISGIAREIIYFFICRLATGILDVIIMYVFVERLMFYDILIKVLDNILVIVLNYIASKLVIFKKNN